MAYGSNYNNVYTNNLLGRWGNHINAVKSLNESFSDERSLKLAICLDNTEKALSHYTNLYESTQPSDIGPFKKYAFDIITAVMADTILDEIVSVQPIAQKVAQIFFLKYLYGSTKGKIKKGSTMFDPRTLRGNEFDPTAEDNFYNPFSNYSSETIDEEEVGTTSGTSFEGNLSYIPVQPGTIKFTVGALTVEDDGQGNLTGGGATGTVDYTSGAVQITFGTDPGSEPVLAAYEFDLEYAPSTIPQVDIKVEEGTIRARARKLRATYAFDAGYDLHMSQGVNIDDALLEAATNEIKYELEGEVLSDLYRGAGLTSTWRNVYDATAAGISQRDFRMTFIDEIIDASNKIFSATRRATGNFIVVGHTGATILESIGAPRYVGTTSGKVVGPHLAGILDGKFKVYKNPYFGPNQYLVGYNGQTFYDSGYIFAPYLPVFSSQLLMLDDFIGRRGFATSNGKKMVNANLYVRGNIINA